MEPYHALFLTEGATMSRVTHAFLSAILCYMFMSKRIKHIIQSNKSNDRHIILSSKSLKDHFVCYWFFCTEQYIPMIEVLKIFYGSANIKEWSIFAWEWRLWELFWNGIDIFWLLSHQLLKKNTSDVLQNPSIT